MKTILITALMLVGFTLQADEYRITKDNAKDFRINGEKISDLGVEYVAINGASKGFTRGGFNMTIDVGESNSIWGDGEITMNGKKVDIKSPMFMVNLFVENGYELVSIQNTMSATAMVVQYILRKKQ